MSTRTAAVLAHFERCRRVAEGREEPSDDERAAFPALIAREYARAEARREPTPQLQLPEAA
jgi:hypothetical protein